MHGSQYMVAMARAAREGGAKGLRANGPEDIRAIRAAVDLPMIGIEKRHYPGSDVYITPTFECARRVAEAGASLIAIDATARPRPNGEDLTSLVARIHHELQLPVMADCSCMDDAAAAAAAGVEILATTLSGYTSHGRKALPGPDLEFISALAQAYSLPVIAEGRFEQPNQVAAAFELGAHAVVVGGAITRPQLITRRFAAAANDVRGSQRYFAAVSVVLDEIAASEGPAIAQAAVAVVRSIRSGGTIYLFDTNQSHGLVNDEYYRTQGWATVVPILPPAGALDETAGSSSLIERSRGIARTAFDRYHFEQNDVLIVFSSSGVSAAPVEMALGAKERGLTVISVQSTRSAPATAAGAIDLKLAEYADFVIDTHLPGGSGPAWPDAAVIGAFILSGLLTEVKDVLAAGD